MTINFTNLIVAILLLLAVVGVIAWTLTFAFVLIFVLALDMSTTFR